jgi:hypothetical protein
MQPLVIPALLGYARWAMSISCEITWEKLATLLRECKAHSTSLYVESTLKEGEGPFEGTVTDVLEETRTVVFKIVVAAFGNESGKRKDFALGDATSFTLTTGATGNWELKVVFGQQGPGATLSFATGGGHIDPPTPLA